jgi:hypothetical protein
MRVCSNVPAAKVSRESREFASARRSGGGNASHGLTRNFHNFRRFSQLVPHEQD